MKRHESSTVKSMTLSVFVAACAFLAAPAMAATEPVTPGPLPPERVNGNVIYLSGGIGQEEAAALRQNESNYPLALEFIRNGESGAEFLAGVSVTIKDAQGNVVLAAASEGPLLLAKLPDGKYKVIAAAGKPRIQGAGYRRRRAQARAHRLRLVGTPGVATGRGGSGAGDPMERRREASAGGFR